MTHYVALFRGINVGGHNVLPMKALREILAGLGCTDVQTYIQSGNAVFSSDDATDELARDVSTAVHKKFGFEPAVLVLTAKQFRAIATEHPFRDLAEDPKHLHTWFLAAPCEKPDLDMINDLKIESERYDLARHAFYLHAPDGIGRSKLAAKVDRCLGVPTTARNVNTVNKLLELLGDDIS